MKTLFLLFSLLLTTASYSSIDTLQPKSKINEVTVFFNGAQVSRSVNLSLSQGKHLLFFDQLPREMNPQSIQVKGISGLQILSVKHQLNYKDQGKKTDEERRVQEQIDNITLEKRRIMDKINVFEIEERLLLDNSKVYQGNEGTTVEKLAKTADFYRERLNTIRSKKHDLSQETKKLHDEMEEAFKKLNQLTVEKRKTYSQVLIAVNCRQNMQKKLNFSYYISSAGWEPMYDFRVKDISSPLAIVYNANVFQSSGEDWKSVDITLSSNNPTLSGVKPEMGRLYLERGRQPSPRSTSTGFAAVTGRIFDAESGEALPFANITILKGTKQIAGTTSDFDGMYSIKPIPPGSYSIEISYVGYQDQKIHNISLSEDQVALQDFAIRPGVALQEVKQISYQKPRFQKDQSTVSTSVARQEIEKMAVRSVANIAKTSGKGVFSRNDGSTETFIRGARSNASVTFIDGVKYTNLTETDFISNSLKRNTTHLEYKIDIPYTIPSDGENYNLKIKEVQLDVEYVYYAVPKLDNDAFLTAKIPDWNNLNLLSGKTSIYYEGTFTNESYLDVDRAEDTLSISLGRDKGIYISRTADKRLYDKKRFGRDLKETVGWNITLKNNKLAPVKIIVEDQIPLSNRKSIEVELLQSNGANFNENTGTLKWELEMNASEKKELEFSFQVEYPEYINLSID